MALLVWTQEAFGTSVSEADHQHQEIFSMLNGLHDTLATGDRQSIGRQLDALIDYVAMHFKTEEDLMQAHGYPDFAAHKAAHDQLVQTCLDVQKKFHAGTLEITPETTGFVKDWLVHHIPSIDKHYGPFFNGKGIT